MKDAIPNADLSATARKTMLHPVSSVADLARTGPTLFANVWLVVGLVIAMLIYAVLRNLPWAPFSNLAP